MASRIWLSSRWTSAPYTCIAGANGVGKSNIFRRDSVSVVVDRPHDQSSRLLQIRSPEQDTGEIGDLFFSANGETRKNIKMAAEMIVDSVVVDDFGRPEEASSTFLRYEVAFRHEPPSHSAGPLGGLVLEREELRHIPSGDAAERLGFTHNKRQFRNSVIYNKRRGSGFISTRPDKTIVIQPGWGLHPEGRVRLHPRSARRAP